MNKSIVHNERPKDYQLAAKRIDIWQIPLNTLPNWAFGLLNDEEQARAQRFYFERHRRRFTVARAMLRVLLGHYLNQPPQQLVFTYNAHGKPHIANDRQLTFNLSHSHETALVAVGCCYPLGIDIEYFSSRPFTGIAKQLFAPAEITALSTAVTALQPFVFFNIWAQKEAFIKASGLGLAYPTQEFTVTSQAGSPTIVADPLHKQAWQLFSFMPKVACCAALCCHPDIKTIHFTSLPELSLTL